MAMDMNSELENQNEQIDRITIKVDFTSYRLLDFKKVSSSQAKIMRILPITS